MYCSKCGNEIKNGQKFCTKCGARLVFDSAPEEKQSAVKTSEINSMGEPKKESVPVNVPRNPRIHEFQINFANTIKGIAIFLIVVSLFTMFFFFCVAIFAILIGKMSPFGVVVMIVLEAFPVFAIVLAIVYMIKGKQYIYFQGRMITTKTSKGKKEYDCSDVISITCGKFRWRYYWVYYIEWIFSDQKKYRVSTTEKGFYETAGYFLDMIDSGVISPNAVTAENKELLRRYEVKAWD